MEKNVHNGHRERMFAKFLEDSGNFYDHEILEILLYSALPRKDTNPLAHALLRRFGSLKNVLSADAQSLMTVDGVGEKVAAYLRFQGELHRRLQFIEPEKVSIGNYREARNYVRKKLAGCGTEQLLFVYLDAAGTVLNASAETDGDVSSVKAGLMDMVRSAAALRASGILVAHNHPSGCARPSDEDVSATKDLLYLCRLSGIRLFDHLIVSSEECYSFRGDPAMERIFRQ